MFSGRRNRTRGAHEQRSASGGRHRPLARPLGSKGINFVRDRARSSLRPPRCGHRPTRLSRPSNPARRPWPTAPIADAGDTAFYIKADPFLPPRNVAVLKKGVWAHYMKGAFELFYLQKIKRDLPSTHFGW